MYLHMFIYTYVHIYIYTYIHMYIRPKGPLRGLTIYTHIYIYIHTHVYVFTYMYIYICTYIHIYIHTHVHQAKALMVKLVGPLRGLTHFSAVVDKEPLDYDHLLEEGVRILGHDRSLEEKWLWL